MSDVIEEIQNLKSQLLRLRRYVSGCPVEFLDSFHDSIEKVEALAMRQRKQLEIARTFILMVQERCLSDGYIRGQTYKTLDQMEAVERIK